MRELLSRLQIRNCIVHSSAMLLVSPLSHSPSLSQREYVQTSGKTEGIAGGKSSDDDDGSPFSWPSLIRMAPLRGIDFLALPVILFSELRFNFLRDPRGNLVEDMHSPRRKLFSFHPKANVVTFFSRGLYLRFTRRSPRGATFIGPNHENFFSTCSREIAQR